MPKSDVNAEELKRIHGKDVELAPDDSEDEKLTEKDALARAKKEGIEFVDEFTVEGSDKTYKTRAAAEKAADGANITQTRRSK